MKSKKQMEELEQRKQQSSKTESAEEKRQKRVQMLINSRQKNYAAKSAAKNLSQNKSEKQFLKSRRDPEPEKNAEQLHSADKDQNQN